MSLTDERLDAAIREALGESRKASGDHPDPDVLLAYHEDDLPEPDAEAVRQHLAECLECSHVILDFAAFPDLEPATEAHRATPTEMRREWSGLQSRIAARRSPWWRSHEYVGLPAAALFLVAVLGLSVWVWQLRESNVELRETVSELEAPNGEMSLAIVEPSSEQDRGSGAVQLVQGTGKGRVLLYLLVSETPYRSERLDRYDRYTLDVRSSTDHFVLRGLPVRLQPEGGFLVDLPAELLERGSSTIEIYGEGPGGRELVHEYLVAPDPGAERGGVGADQGPDRVDP